MTTIEITAGGKQGAFNGNPGVYTATLTGHSMAGPFEAKQPKYDGETYMLHEWEFAVEDAPNEAAMVWMTSGESTGPKSKTFAIMTALFGGTPPPVGTKIDVEKHLVGRAALLDIRRNDRGYLDVVGIMPLPTKGAAKPATPRSDSDLPF